MKTRVAKAGCEALATSGKHAVALALRWPEEALQGLLGFAIRRTQDGGEPEWAETAIQFEGRPVVAGALHPSNEAPIQSMIWCDHGSSSDRARVGLKAGASYVYDVFEMRGTADAPVPSETPALSVAISTESEKPSSPKAPEVHFNRGLSSMQEYERLFGEGHEPDGDEAALDWLARRLRRAILDFIGEAAADETLRLDVAAYHLDDPDILKALEGIGDRLRISLDWGPEEREETPGPNGPARKALEAAGAAVHRREHVSISHNKYMVLKQDDGAPLAVLTGSTNFTTGGVCKQSNQSVIIRDPDLVAAYLRDFERVLNDDNEGLRDSNAKGSRISDAVEVYFSPHHAADRPDLDRLAELASSAQSSRLFLTFRMTDPALIDAMLAPGVPAFGVVDRAYRGGDDSGDRLIFEEAHAKDPRIAACNAPLDDEPEEGALLRELKREGYEPLLHHKILLLDWNGPDCIVATGSANYSTNSTAHNDENTVVIHGDERLAEEYFVEVCRLFTHWRPRWLRERDRRAPRGAEHLDGTSGWTDAWRSGRMADFLDMVFS